MKKIKKYNQIRKYIKKRVQIGKFPVGSLLPSENEFCEQFSTTRTTVRKALDELLKEGYIRKEHGKGSRVVERRKSLGLLTVKGFSEVTNYKVTTLFLKKPRVSDWSSLISFSLTDEEKDAPCVYFQRVRCLDNEPIVLEHNWYSQNVLEPLSPDDFIDGSFFKTLSQEYLIEIMGSEQELRAEMANKEVAEHLNLKVKDPVLHISVKFKTSNPKLNLYSEIYCKTSTVPVRNFYYL